MGKDETTINTDDRTLTIPIGLRQVIDKMMHTPPTPAEMETAINEVEDAIATIGSATPIMMNISTSDLWVRKAVKLYDENATMPYTPTKTSSGRDIQPTGIHHFRPTSQHRPATFGARICRYAADAARGDESSENGGHAKWSEKLASLFLGRKLYVFRF